MVDYISAKNGLTKVLTRRVLDDFLKVVETGLLLRERVSIGGLGRASLAERPPRRARIVKNPATGEEMTIPAQPRRLAPKMTFSRKLKEKAAALEIE
jgi:nucleoid DNA-binding protein